MSTALAVCHGSFGRIPVYRPAFPMGTHAHREGRLTFHLGAPPAIVTTGGTVSTVRIWVKLAMLPAASETVMTTRWGPLERKPAVTQPAIVTISNVPHLVDETAGLAINLPLINCLTSDVRVPAAACACGRGHSASSQSTTALARRGK